MHREEGRCPEKAVQGPVAQRVASVPPPGPQAVVCRAGGLIRHPLAGLRLRGPSWTLVPGPQAPPVGSVLAPEGKEPLLCPSQVSCLLDEPLARPSGLLLPGEFHGWRSLEGCSPWGR